MVGNNASANAVQTTFETLGGVQRWTVQKLIWQTKFQNMSKQIGCKRRNVQRDGW